MFAQPPGSRVGRWTEVKPVDVAPDRVRRGIGFVIKTTTRLPGKGGNPHILNGPEDELTKTEAKALASAAEAPAAAADATSAAAASLPPDFKAQDPHPSTKGNFGEAAGKPSSSAARSRSSSSNSSSVHETIASNRRVELQHLLAGAPDGGGRQDTSSTGRIESPQTVPPTKLATPSGEASEDGGNIRRSSGTEEVRTKSFARSTSSIDKDQQSEKPQRQQQQQQQQEQQQQKQPEHGVTRSKPVPKCSRRVRQHSLSRVPWRVSVWKARLRASLADSPARSARTHSTAGEGGLSRPNKERARLLLSDDSQDEQFRAPKQMSRASVKEPKEHSVAQSRSADWRGREAASEKVQPQRENESARDLAWKASRSRSRGTRTAWPPAECDERLQVSSFKDETVKRASQLADNRPKVDSMNASGGSPLKRTQRKATQESSSSSEAQTHAQARRAQMKMAVKAAPHSSGTQDQLPRTDSKSVSGTRLPERERRVAAAERGSSSMEVCMQAAKMQGTSAASNQAAAESTGTRDILVQKEANAWAASGSSSGTHKIGSKTEKPPSEARAAHGTLAEKHGQTETGLESKSCDEACDDQAPWSWQEQLERQLAALGEVDGEPEAKPQIQSAPKPRQDRQRQRRRTRQRESPEDRRAPCSSLAASRDEIAQQEARHKSRRVRGQHSLASAEESLGQQAKTSQESSRTLKQAKQGLGSAGSEPLRTRRRCERQHNCDGSTPGGGCAALHAFLATEPNLGFRDYMEDGSMVVDPFAVEDDAHWGFYAVYDGHGGRQVVDYCEAKLHTILLDELHAARPRGGAPLGDKAVETAFIHTFQRVDDRLRLLRMWLCGCTATVALVRRTPTSLRLYVANVGDTRSVVISERRGESRVSYDHKATDAAEMKRVEADGGFISRERVAGQLCVSRALGDISLKTQGVTCRPYTHSCDVSGDDALIIASDGLWDAVDDREAQKYVLQNIIEKTPEKAAHMLVRKAVDRGSTDNICCLVVYLKKSALE